MPRAPARWPRSTPNRDRLRACSRACHTNWPATDVAVPPGRRRTLQRGGCPHVQALCLAQLALLEIDGDDWDAAILTERARSRVEGCGLAEYPIVALVYAVSALTRSHSGPVEDAHRDLRTASRLIDTLVDFIPWYEAETLHHPARCVARPE